MVGWHHQLHGYEFEQDLGAGDEQGNLACCSPLGLKESDMTKQLNTINNIGREEVKLLLFAADMILHIANAKDATKKTIRINEFSEVRYKIINYKSVAFLYTNNKVLFTIRKRN